MEEQIKLITGAVDLPDIEMIARAVLGSPAVRISGQPSWQEIGAVHNDERTVAIVRCSGEADVEGGSREWSTVVKAVDASQADRGEAAAWINPLIEEQIYELALLTDTGAPFRPARCFQVIRHNDNVKLFWLEDLTGAPQPPWNLDEYLRVARHLGEFNGRTLGDPPDLPFKLPVDLHRARYERARRTVSPGLESLIENETHPLNRAALRDVPVDALIKLYKLWGELVEVTPGLPHGLAFGDSHARNLFPLSRETVAVDWGGLAYDPVGTDLSVLIGAALTWSLDEAIMIGQHEGDIFEAYLSGLSSAGWAGKRDDIRRALFTHLPLYLLFTGIMPDGIRSGRALARKDWIEERRGETFENIPEQIAPITALIPGYVKELNSLLS